MTASSVLASCHKRPIRGIFALVCPRAASGHATAPPSTPRNARRFMSNPRLRRRHRNDKNEHFGRGLEWTSGTGHCAARPMSQMGQSRRFGDVRVTSAFPLIADVRQRGRQVRKVPTRDMCRRLAVNCQSRSAFSRYAKAHPADPRHKRRRDPMAAAQAQLELSRHNALRGQVSRCVTTTHRCPVQACAS